MSYLWAICSFVLGAIEFGSGKDIYLAISWFVVSALFTIAGNIAYGRKS